MNKKLVFWQSYLNLEEEFLNLTKYIYITDKVTINSNGETNNYKYQLETFSPFISDLLVNCCIQIESIIRELYIKLFGNSQHMNQDKYDYNWLKEIDKKYNLSSNIVKISNPLFDLSESNLSIKPLKKACTRDANWQKAYQLLKHDHFNNLRKGNIKNLMDALAALYLLNIYYRNKVIYTSHRNIENIDYSFGSSIFSVESPNLPTLNDIVHYYIPIKNKESPFTIDYAGIDFDEMLNIQNKQQKEYSDYYFNQPELKEEEYRKIHNNLMNKQLNGEKVDFYKELAKYRIMKIIGSEESFNAKTNIVVQSDIWKNLCQTNVPMDIYFKEEDKFAKDIESICNNWSFFYISQMLKPMNYLDIVLDKDIIRIHTPFYDSL